MALRAPSRKQLHQEAEKIHRAIFHAPLPAETRARFTEASLLLNQTQERADNERYYRIIQSLNDLESLEIAGRYTHQWPHLSAKFCLMLYIAETRPETQAHLLNEDRNFAKAWLSIMVGLVQTAYKLTKGFFLLRSTYNA